MKPRCISILSAALKSNFRRLSILSFIAKDNAFVVGIQTLSVTRKYPSLLQSNGKSSWAIWQLIVIDVSDPGYICHKYNQQLRVSFCYIVWRMGPNPKGFEPTTANVHKGAQSVMLQPLCPLSTLLSSILKFVWVRISLSQLKNKGTKMVRIRGSKAQWLEYVHPDPAAPVSIPSIPEFFSEDIVDVAA